MIRWNRRLLSSIRIVFARTFRIRPALCNDALSVVRCCYAKCTSCWPTKAVSLFANCPAQASHSLLQIGFLCKYSWSTILRVSYENGRHYVLFWLKTTWFFLVSTHPMHAIDMLNVQFLCHTPNSTTRLRAKSLTKIFWTNP